MNNFQAQTSEFVHAHGPQEADLSFWYRPWLYTHSSWSRSEERAWMNVTDSDELVERMRYPAWCDMFSLARHPVQYDGSIWWKVASVYPGAFDRANYLVGLILVFAMNRRECFALTRTSGSAATNAGDLRWVLQNACFVPKAVLDMEGWKGISDANLSGFLSLKFALGVASPSLVQRTVLRYRRDLAQHETPAIRLSDAEQAERCARFVERLWMRALNRCGVELSEADSHIPQVA